MKKEEALQKLRSFATQGIEILRLLEEQPRNAVAEPEIRGRVTQLKQELETEYARTQPDRAQRSLTLFELSVYCPTIEETWKDSGIHKLKIEAPIDQKWQDVMETIVFLNAEKHPARLR